MPTFTVERLSFQHLAALPNAWQNADYLALLTKLDYDSPEAIAPAELKEMTQLALTDLEPAAAAPILDLTGVELRVLIELHRRLLLAPRSASAAKLAGALRPGGTVT